MRITRITRESYSGKVHNLETKPDHNYFANNILTHNCYKSNLPTGKNMTLDEFKELMEVIYSPFLTQVAFGVGSLDASEFIFPIMEYTRSLGIIPNITINGSRMTDELFEKLAMVAGAVAVSNYSKDLCYNTVQRLNQEKKKAGATLKSVNIHQLLSQTTLSSCWEVLHDMQTDPRLSELGAVVFLTLKKKGKRNNLIPLTDINEYKKLITYALDNKLSIGFDSCNCGHFEKAISGRKEENQLKQISEKCESTLFSLYTSVDRNIYPCSFTEDTTGWEEGIPAMEHNSIIDIWKHQKLNGFRDRLLSNCRNCPIYDLGMK